MGWGVLAKAPKGPRRWVQKNLCEAQGGSNALQRGPTDKLDQLGCNWARREGVWPMPGVPV